MTFDALGFDFDHTLGRDNGLERRAFVEYARDLGCPFDEHDPALGRHIDAALERVRAGAASLDEVIPAFYREHCSARASAQEWKQHCFALVPELVRPSDGAVELLAGMRARGIPGAILTNGWTPLQQMKIARALGPHAVTTILVSDGIGALKPARAAFEALRAALGLPAARIAYVGDNPTADVAGALGAGMQAIWVDADGLVYPQDLPPPTLAVKSLGELGELIENTKVP